MDFNAADGISWTDCGTVTTAATPSVGLAPQFYGIHTETTARQFDVDYFRIWQDDALTDETPAVAIDDAAAAVNLASIDFSVSGQTQNSYTAEELLAWFDQAPAKAEQATVLQVSADRLVAGLDIVTPNLTTKGLRIDTIKAFSNIIKIMSDAEFFGRPYFNTDTADICRARHRSLF